MYRFAWFIAGAVVGYIASGFIEGVKEGWHTDATSRQEATEETAACGDVAEGGA